MTNLRYHFGTGTGPVTVWQSPADADLDHDGTADAVLLDFDGDGRVDDAMWDSDGDAAADTTLLDLDDDGHADHGYRDPSGLGTWNERGAALPIADAKAQRLTDLGWTDLGWTDLAGHRHRSESIGDGAWVDVDRDGRAGEWARDADRDGRADSVLLDPDRDGTVDSAFADVDGDGRWDLRTVDSDGDGVVDQTYRAGEPGFAP